MMEDGSSSSSSEDSDSSSSSSSRPGIKKEEAKELKTKIEVKSEEESESSSSEEEVDDDLSDLDAEEEVDLEDVQGPGAMGMKDLIVTEEPVPLDPSYPGNWIGAPPLGAPGFNRFAARVMWNAGIGKKKEPAITQGGCPPLQPHQKAVAFLLHPQSPVSRLLVDHPTGSGKTREMIQVLDNYFLDPRPKVPIFPKDPVCRNFYVELLRWPSRYRDFFSCLRPQDAVQACGCSEWRRRRAELWDLAE
ncbi:unnamed protein product, partial [Effrenium voratum]